MPNNIRRVIMGRDREDRNGPSNTKHKLHPTQLGLFTGCDGDTRHATVVG